MKQVKRLLPNTFSLETEVALLKPGLSEQINPNVKLSVAMFISGFLSIF